MQSNRSPKEGNSCNETDSARDRVIIIVNETLDKWERKGRNIPRFKVLHKTQWLWFHTTSTIGTRSKNTTIE